ncbi:MlaA family lipoprotein [Pseudoalteromonas tunicata]|jgi:phospholipid-binding lipoprotein MlaA|uniref:Lipoprotein n=1 Tax=Pseudoalteromonas tunicata D2 TaxID=87626 RepID=A4C695_9GAMM|nr:VacJ family lipoprotein [Pseudoalteromonas tunicata]ATC95474.1 phospholipid-binding lipoprotein MlaA [Pseudoalteromonas tunicata]AXT31048.1 VacJ family lipoprotein [Pseudoalteromonas tunicata]EAR29499.1 lipoprotein precursor [Pseudoalteromonas tunicata D2]MDP5212403.1 VacJ family lipoprotein [Pseudoalteromonas tunicata]
MFRTAAMLGILLILFGCAQVPEEKKDARDPLQVLNRPVYDFNMQVLDAYLLRPAAVGYATVTPQPVRSGIVNFIENLQTPIDTVNAVFQGKPSNAGVGLARFLINSTVGVFGIFDVASEIGLELVKEDFGQTLGVWGIGDGAYLMLPAMGPSTARNFTGDVVDNLVIPQVALSTPQSLIVFAFKALEARASLIPQEGLLNESLDPYIFMKDIYFQRQLFELYDGNPPLKQEPDNYDEDFLENL